MNLKVPACGIFPKLPEEEAVMGEAQAWDLMQGTRNYASVYDLLEAAEEEIRRYV